MPDESTAKTAPWTAPDKGAAERPGFIARGTLLHTASQNISGKDMWIARHNDPREAALSALMGEASHKLGLKETPKLVIFKSDWPETIRIGKKYLAVSTGLADILTPEQTKAMMEQQLEAVNHKTGFITKYFIDPTLIVGGAAGAQQLASRKWKSLDLRNISNEKTFLITSLILGAAKFVGWELLERWRDRRHDVQQDTAAAKLSGKDAMLGALEAVQKRETELEQQGEHPKWTKRLPTFIQKTASTETRISALQKNVPDGFAARVSSTSTPSQYAGKS